MASVSEDEAGSERCSGSYSPSADVSGSETSSDCSTPTTTRRFPFSSSSRGLASSSSSQIPTPSSASRASIRCVCVCSPEVDMMKERFAKLLLGEDMSGSGKASAPRSPSPTPSPNFSPVLGIPLKSHPSLNPFIHFCLSHLWCVRRFRLDLKSALCSSMAAVDLEMSQSEASSEMRGVKKDRGHGAVILPPTPLT